MTPPMELVESGSDDWLAHYPSYANCNWRNPFLSSSNQIPEEGPPWLRGERKKGRKQIRISRGIKGSFPAICFRTSAGSLPTNLLENLTRGNTHQLWALQEPQVLNPYLLLLCCCLPSASARVSPSWHRGCSDNRPRLGGQGRKYKLEL